MHLENLLLEETSKMTKTTGGWSAEANCTLAHSARGSLYFETLESDVRQNAMDVTAAGAGDMTVVTEQFSVSPETLYKAFAWAGGTVNTSSMTIGVRFYSVDSVLLLDSPSLNTNIPDDVWVALSVYGFAPAGSYLAELYITFNSATAGQEIRVARPSVISQAQLVSTFLDNTYEYVPDYIIEDDYAQTADISRVAYPLTRYLGVVTDPLHKVQDGVISWDYLDPTETVDGLADTSALVDPFKTDAEALPWLAQLMGVSLDTVPSGGRSPWLSFETAGIDTWVEWEEDVDPGSIPGVPDTEWTDIETFSPDFFNVDRARRLQIAAGFNGVLGGTSESIIRYVGALLNTDSPDPFVYVVKHYGSNPYRILVAILETEDPDPNGDMIERAVEAATPAGTDVIVEHGVTASARIHYRVPDFFQRMWTTLGPATSDLPVRIVENTAATGHHMRLASITGSPEPFYGGTVALARWSPGFAVYSGAVSVSTEAHSSLNFLSDLDIRVYISDMDVPDSGSLSIVSSDDKWDLSVNSSGLLEFSWENGGTQTVTSTAAPDWGNVDKGPFWLRVTLDLNNDASGHDVDFYQANTLYEDAWPQVGATVTTAGVSGIDSSANANINIFKNGTNPADGAAAFVYRVMCHDGIDGSIGVDLNLLGEFPPAESTSPHTGSQFWRIPVSNIVVTANPAVQGATNLVESRWVANNHGGGDDYFYFGKSPNKDNGANPTNLGDTVTVTDLPVDTYDWTITLRDGSTVTGSTGSVSAITWDADDHGGLSIVNIIVREDTGQTVQALFSPDLFEGEASVGIDTYSRTWTLVRSFNTAYYYEYSSFNDRSSISAFDSDAAFFTNFPFYKDDSITISVAARRFWTSAGTTTIVDHTTTSGWKLQYNGTNIEAIITDGVTPVTLTYDEGASAFLGQYNLITLRRDIPNNEISLWINETKEDTAADPFANGSPFATVGDTGTFGDPLASNKFDFRFFGIFDRPLTDEEIVLMSAEMGRVVPTLPQAARVIAPPTLPVGTVHTPGFDLVDWIITPTSVIDASPTIHSPQVNMSVLVNYIATGHTVHEPTSVSIV